LQFGSIFCTPCTLPQVRVWIPLVLVLVLVLVLGLVPLGAGVG
jgi:hypothetical protein